MFVSEYQLLSYIDLIIQRCDLYQLFKFVNIYPNIINKPDKLKIIASNLNIKYKVNFIFKDIILRLSVINIIDISYELNNDLLLQPSYSTYNNNEYLYGYLKYKIDQAIIHRKLLVLTAYLNFIKDDYAYLEEYLFRQTLITGDIETFIILINVYGFHSILIFPFWNYINSKSLMKFILSNVDKNSSEIHTKLQSDIDRHRERKRISVLECRIIPEVIIVIINHY
jgi:hypothetical protein